MLTVNLEKELIRQNRKVLVPDELLKVKEYERLGDDICDNEILSRIGMNQEVKQGRHIKAKTEMIKGQLSHFDQSRVFHISQIKSLCEKYHLRFLSASKYKGSIDKQLPFKISTFETANSCPKNLRYWDYKIAAPAKSFKLEEKPKDPLFFADLGNDYWYLVHKWGNDLSLIRRFYKLLSNAWLAYITIASVILYLGVSNTTVKGDELSGWGLILFIVLIAYTIISAIAASDGSPLRFIKKNNWESTYL